MVSAYVDTGAAGTLEIQAVEGATDAFGNQSFVSWAAYYHERVSYGSTWQPGISAYVETNYGLIWSGAFDFDWRPAGLQSTLIASGGFWTSARNPDGTGYINFGVGMGSTGTIGGGGPAYVSVTLPLVTLKVPPNTPTGMTATRISDTQTSLSWTQTNASNGAPTSVLVQHRVNGGAWTDLVGMSPVTSATVSTAPNRKTEYRVRSGNTAGTTAFSAASAPIYTTPAAPTNPLADKNVSLDITVSFDENVDYSEHTHEVWHGTVTGGVTTWDGAALATLASGVTSYVHVAPNAAQVHIYRIRAKAGALASGYATTAPVQLLAPPNKPTVPALPAFFDKASAFTFPWVHNPIDTTPQKSYEVGYSTNGGSTWNTTGKVNSVVPEKVFAANSYPANTVLTLRVRTWGSATTAGSDGTGASPWSDLSAVTFKTVPTATITTPANASTVNESILRVTLGFAQAEAATFVKAQLELLHGATLLETLESSILVGITMATPIENEESYTVRARVQDSNGLWSAWVTSTFDVEYLAPVPAGVVVTYLPETGYGQLDITIPAPGVGQSAADTITITRTIDGATEVIVQDYPATADMTFLDTTPTIHGTNTYTVTTTSDEGAQTTVTIDLVTDECRRAFLSKGAGFSNVVVFGANLQVNESLSVASDVVSAAGRTKPIGLYGIETSVQLKVGSFVFARDGFSTIPQLRDFLLVPGKTLYRDASGRRVFGTVKGAVKYEKVDRGDLSFTMTETS